MLYAGIDVHKRCTQICIQDEEGVLQERRILTERRRLIEEFGNRPKMRILLEAATESEWVARCLEGLGHEVIVLDNLSTGSIDNIAHLKPHAAFSYHIDSVANEPLLAELIDRSDVVYHLAAAVGVATVAMLLERLAHTGGELVHARLHDGHIAEPGGASLRPGRHLGALLDAQHATERPHGLREQGQRATRAAGDVENRFAGAQAERDRGSAPQRAAPRPGVVLLGP